MTEKRKKKVGRGQASNPTELGRAFRFPPDVNRNVGTVTIKGYKEVLELLNKIKGYYGFTAADTMLIFWPLMQAELERLMKRELAQMEAAKATK